jgi:hypothetical protein
LSIIDSNVCSDWSKVVELSYEEAVEVGREAARARDRASEDATIRALSTLSPNDGWSAVEEIDQTTEDDWCWRLVVRRALSTCAPTADTSA